MVVVMGWGSMGGCGRGDWGVGKGRRVKGVGGWGKGDCG